MYICSMKSKNTMVDDMAYDTRRWRDLGFSDKIKYSSALLLILASIILGFVSFILLQLIPTSLIATMGLWISAALAIFGISSYFHNEMVSFQNKVDERLTRLDKDLEQTNTTE